MIREISNDNDIRMIADMAETIWHEAFAGIITEEQIEYMLDKFQSYNAIKDQTENHGYRYFILDAGGVDAGYCGIRKQEDGTMYLSKMYLLASARGRGLFAEMACYLTDICRKEGIRKIWLTVNKNNGRAMAAYTKCGFRNVRNQVTDIGRGFVMDDYVFELEVK